MPKIKNYFIASETNDYRPFITSTTALVLFVAIIWCLRLILPASISLAQSYIDPTDVANRINTERTSRNIPPVSTNDKLVTAANGKANDMLSRSYFSHIDPDGNYVWPRIEAAGYTPYSILGENLAMDFTSASDMVAAWMNSPTHRANLLNDQFKDQGVAQASGLYEPGHDTTIVVSLFGALAQTSHVQTAPTGTSNPPVAGTSTPSNDTSKPDQLAIGSDAQVSVTQVSGHSLVSVSVSATGNPTLVTARLLTQSITLLPQDGRFAGTFTFNLSDQLSGQQISIEARNAAGEKTESQVQLSQIESIPPGPDAENATSTTAPSPIPVSQEAQVMNILRIIFGILSVIYLGFLVTDWIIIHRAHVDRPGAHLAPQIAVFFILALVNLFVKF
ncbi:MAG TPA: CAP domain-containing protein [Patescibacteria group bacterium]|nr:CAP domain-containing protein [Patescibacteria group bacterium]